MNFTGNVVCSVSFFRIHELALLGNQYRSPGGHNHLLRESTYTAEAVCISSIRADAAGAAYFYYESLLNRVDDEDKTGTAVREGQFTGTNTQPLSNKGKF